MEDNSNNLIITPEIKSYLYTTVRWTKLMSILGFIGLGFLVIAVIVILCFGAFFGGLNSDINGGLEFITGGFIAIIYLGIGALYLAPLLYLYRFSTKTKWALDSNDQTLLAEGFNNIKKHYKFIGILSLIVISVYALIFVFVFLSIIVAV